MTKYLITYIIVLTIFLIIDVIWLGFIAKKFYFGNLGYILADKPNMQAAAIFYSLYVVGILIFSTIPALRDGSANTALIYGALFGFFAYLTYDMTNYSTLKDWPLQVSIVDTIWGTVLTGLSSYIGYHISKLFVNFS
ncbi:MAG: DUF2177 family protein [Rhizobiales bacterium]|nr:DUF2177 family protein [Hyphomicrobiales bacterium]MBL6770194.1 DUF2177 family protein [Hyphomicrobiales bacterium]